MSGRRPSRGTKVVYREVGSDGSDSELDEDVKIVTVENVDDDSDDSDYTPGNSVESYNSTSAKPEVYPPLTPLQLQLRKVCRLGDKNILKTFLTENPGIDLDIRDPDGATLLNEAVTKTAQFSEIVSVLLAAGAGMEVTDSLGNTPLHNAVLYYPSTQQTVDLLLERGADAAAKNHEGSTPMALADDKDLKLVLKELKKAAGRKKSSADVSLYINSPQLRRKVFDRKLLEERNNQRIIVRYNSPVVVKSPGLLKRKREREEFDERFGGRRKRIRWCEQDSTGADIDPQFSEEEKDTEQEDVENDMGNDDPSNELIQADHNQYTEHVNKFEVNLLPNKIGDESGEASINMDVCNELEAGKAYLYIPDGDQIDTNTLSGDIDNGQESDTFNTSFFMEESQKVDAGNVCDDMEKSENVGTTKTFADAENDETTISSAGEIEAGKDFTEDRDNEKEIQTNHSSDDVETGETFLDNADHIDTDNSSADDSVTGEPVTDIYDDNDDETTSSSTDNVETSKTFLDTDNDDDVDTDNSSPSDVETGETSTDKDDGDETVILSACDVLKACTGVDGSETKQQTVDIDIAANLETANTTDMDNSESNELDNPSAEIDTNHVELIETDKTSGNNQYDGFHFEEANVLIEANTDGDMETVMDHRKLSTEVNMESELKEAEAYLEVQESNPTMEFCSLETSKPESMTKEIFLEETDFKVTKPALYSKKNEENQNKMNLGIFETKNVDKGYENHNLDRAWDTQHLDNLSETPNLVKIVNEQEKLSETKQAAQSMDNDKGQEVTENIESNLGHVDFKETHKRLTKNIIESEPKSFNKDVHDDKNKEREVKALNKQEEQELDIQIADDYQHENPMFGGKTPAFEVCEGRDSQMKDELSWNFKTTSTGKRAEDEHRYTVCKTEKPCIESMVEDPSPDKKQDVASEISMEMVFSGNSEEENDSRPGEENIEFQGKYEKVKEKIESSDDVTFFLKEKEEFGSTYKLQIISKEVKYESETVKEGSNTPKKELIPIIVSNDCHKVNDLETHENTGLLDSLENPQIGIIDEPTITMDDKMDSEASLYSSSSSSSKARVICSSLILHSTLIDSSDNEKERTGSTQEDVEGRNKPKVSTVRVEQSFNYEVASSKGVDTSPQPQQTNYELASNKGVDTIPQSKQANYEITSSKVADPILQLKQANYVIKNCKGVDISQEPRNANYEIGSSKGEDTSPQPKNTNYEIASNSEEKVAVTFSQGFGFFVS